MRVIVTRPAAQAAEWVARLAAAGIEAIALPLIGIAAVDDPRPLRAAWTALPRFRLAVFVSPNAVLRFFGERPMGMAWPESTLAGSPGPGTTRILREAGVPQSRIAEPAADSAAFDSESLWTALQPLDWRGTEVLVVRGAGGRDWLTTALGSAGASVATLCAYRRVGPSFGPEAAERLQSAIADPAGHLWFFSSSEAVLQLRDWPALPPGADWASARAVATHPRIAATARAVGFGQVVAARPTPDAVVACIQSLQP